MNTPELVELAVPSCRTVQESSKPGVCQASGVGIRHQTSGVRGLVNGVRAWEHGHMCVWAYGRVCLCDPHTGPVRDKLSQNQRARLGPGFTASRRVRHPVKYVEWEFRCEAKFEAGMSFCEASLREVWRYCLGVSVRCCTVGPCYRSR